MPLMYMNYESTPTDGKVRCQPSRNNWEMQKNKLFACFCSCKYHRKNLHDPHHHGQVWVPSRLEQSCRQAVFPLSALACSLKTRFQLLVPIPTQKPPNFKVVIEWWEKVRNTLYYVFIVYNIYIQYIYTYQWHTKWFNPMKPGTFWTFYHRHVDNFVADFWCFLLAPLKY